MIKNLRKLYNQIIEKKRQLYLEDLIEKGLKIGKNSMPVGDFFFDPSHCFLIEIGDNVTFAPNVRLIAHDASSKFLIGYTRISKIKIGDNCFIGDSVTVLPGVSIGNNCIIGTSSLVTRNIPAGSVAIGSPAKVIKTVEQLKSELQSRKNASTSFHNEYLINQLTPKKMQDILTAIDENKEAFLI